MGKILWPILYYPDGTLTLCMAALLRIVDSVRRKELGRWTGRIPSPMEQTPPAEASTREEVGNKTNSHPDRGHRFDSRQMRKDGLLVADEGGDGSERNWFLVLISGHHQGSVLAADRA